MPYRNWSRIDGPVTAHLSMGDTERYDSLVEALRAYVPRYGFFSYGPRYYTDEFGVTIPDWKLEEVARLNPIPAYHPRWRDRRHKFRDGPVEGIRCYRGGSHCLRHIRTQAERRENDFLNYDEDAIEHGIKARGDRRKLPSLWDDIPIGERGRGWKHHRRTQYKV